MRGRSITVVLPPPILRRGNNALEIPLSENSSSLENVKGLIAAHFGIRDDAFYLVQNGRLINDDTTCNPDVCITVVPRILGGKGGFGSMLRAIGAQIEKTTNRDACRDLSGRRLRDINEEQRLKRWFSKQNEREREKEEQRQRKLQKLRQIQEGPPLPLTDDADFNQQRADMSDSVFEAVEAGFGAKEEVEDKCSSDDTSASNEDPTEEACSSDKIPTSSAAIAGKSETSSKVNAAEKPKKNIKRLMMDEDFDSDLSSDESDCEPPTSKVAKLGN